MEVPLVDAEAFYALKAEQADPPVDLSGLPPSEWPAAIYAPALIGAGELADHEPLTPRVNFNRWIVDCPWCSSAQAASKTDPWFLCVECGNSAVAGLKVPVAWPEGWETVELALEERAPANRHWEPTVEPMEAILAENEARGLPVPAPLEEA